MSSDFNFTGTSLSLGSVRVKPYFNTQLTKLSPYLCLKNLWTHGLTSIQERVKSSAVLLLIYLNFPKEIKTRFFHIPSLKILPNYGRHT